MIGYTVSFLEGSSGRFIANILYLLTNSIDNDLEFDHVNSSHDNTLYKSNIDFLLIPDINHEAQTNYLRLFRHLRFLPTDYTAVLPTHSYPLTEDLDANPHAHTFNMVVMELAEQDLIEVNVNHIIKNIWPLLEKIRSIGFDNLSATDNAYLNHTVKSLSEFKVNLMQLDRVEVLERYARLSAEKQLNTNYIRFINPVIDPKYLDKTLVLKYSDLYKETTTGYIALDVLCKFAKVPVTEQILVTYRKYVNGRKQLLKRFDFIK